MASIFGCGIPQSCCDLIVKQINTVVPAGQTLEVDQLPVVDYDAIQWNLVVVDPSQNKRKFQAVFATHENSTTAFHNIFSRVGAPIQLFNYQIEVVMELGSFKLKIVNNSATDYIVEVTRIPVEVYTP